MLIVITLFLFGILLGLTGGGGAGCVIAILTALFGIPIHVALGTSLSAMTFTTLSGAVSHYREGNIRLATGLSVGCFGAVGAFLGAKVASLIPGTQMHWLTGIMLVISALLLYIRLYHPTYSPFKENKGGTELTRSKRFWITALLGGLIVGFLSGTFGIGSTPFIQLLLLIGFGLSLLKTIGTTMLVIMPIAVFGGLGYLLEGNLDFSLFIQVVVGLMLGAYVGAKFTNHVPQPILKFLMVTIPSIGAIVLLLE